MGELDGVAEQIDQHLVQPRGICEQAERGGRRQNQGKALRFRRGTDILKALAFGAQGVLIGRPVTYIDATHLTPEERRPYIEIARTFGCEIEALYFDVPLETCSERNRLRDRVVPDEAMAKMAAKLVPPTIEEGFTRVKWGRFLNCPAFSKWQVEDLPHS